MCIFDFQSVLLLQLAEYGYILLLLLLVFYKVTFDLPLAERKQLRRSTAQKSAQREKREKEREAKVKMMKEIAAKKNVPEVRRLTQEELLEEAKDTEAINLQALGL